MGLGYYLFNIRFNFPVLHYVAELAGFQWASTASDREQHGAGVLPHRRVGGGLGISLHGDANLSAQAQHRRTLHALAGAA